MGRRADIQWRPLLAAAVVLEINRYHGRAVKPSAVLSWATTEKNMGGRSAYIRNGGRFDRCGPGGSVAVGVGRRADHDLHHQELSQGQGALDQSRLLPQRHPRRAHGHGVEHFALRENGPGRRRAALRLGGHGQGGRDEPRQPLSVQDGDRALSGVAQGGQRAAPSTPRPQSPDWSGTWEAGGRRWRRQGPASDTAKLLKPQLSGVLRPAIEGRERGADMDRAVHVSAARVLGVPGRRRNSSSPRTKDWMLSSSFTENTIRWIYTDGSGQSVRTF